MSVLDALFGLAGVALCALAGAVLGGKADREISKWRRK